MELGSTISSVSDYQTQAWGCESHCRLQTKNLAVESLGMETACTEYALVLDMLLTTDWTPYKRTASTDEICELEFQPLQMT